MDERENEELFRTTFEQAAVGIAHVAPDGRCLRVNQRGCDILGYTGEELAGQRLQDITHPDDSALDREYLGQMLGKKIDTYSVEKRFIRKDGSAVPTDLAVSAVRTPSGEPLYLIAVIEDITERRRAEQALLESQQRLELLLLRPDFGMWDENVQTRQVVYSLQYAAMLGYAPEEIAPHEDSWQALLHPDDKPRVLRAFEDHLEGKTPYYQAEYRLRAKSGGWKWVLSRAKVCEWDKSGRPLRVLGTHLNVTGDKELEQKLQDAQRELEQRVKERTAELVVANEQLKREIHERERIEKALRSEEEAIAEERHRIAREIHDGLAQDLASLRFKTRLWQDLLERDPAKMHAELNMLREVLEKNIRDVRRAIFSLRPLALEGTDFCSALRQFADDFGQQNQLGIDVVISGPHERLSRHLELTLFRIIQEALNNAGKHARANRVRIELNLEAADGMLLLRIRDDGIGFDPAWARRDQSVRHGHLGLKHMQERVEGLKGSFALHSRVGEGTEIKIRLPLSGTEGDE